MSSSESIKTLADRLKNASICDGKDNDGNKPDFRELDLGSPISPLRSTRTGGSAPTLTPATTTTTTTSSSSSSSGSVSGRLDRTGLARKPDSSPNRHSGELTVDNSPSLSTRATRPGHGRSKSISSHGSVLSGPSLASDSPAPQVNVLPTGNIIPSGRILKTGMATSRVPKTDVLGSGSVNYGHGSIIRGGTGSVSASSKPEYQSTVKRTGLSYSNDAEEWKRLGNESYKNNNFKEALGLYDKAISLSPRNAAYRFNKAAALIGLKRLVEAVKECEEAIRLDPGYVKAHHRLGSLFLSLGQIENARKHICFQGHPPDPVESQKLLSVEKHVTKCFDSRRIGDWKSTLKAVDAAISCGVDSSPQFFACRAEALLNLHRIDDAFSSLSICDAFPSSRSQLKIFGMLFDAYPFLVRAQVELAMGQFDNAVAAIEKARQIDAHNPEIAIHLNNVKLVGRARARGNELFKSERFTEASVAYGEGLKLDPTNPVLYCNRAACWFRLGQFERSLNDCDQALRVQPNYMKALLRRAASYSKLEHWSEAVRDYEVLRRELPGDNDIAESLFHAQVALKKSRGEDFHNMKFGGEVESVSNLGQFRAAISSHDASVIHFMTASSPECKQISPFVDTLCTKYPSINFLKVDIQERPEIAQFQNVRIVPTFKIYKKGERVKEMVFPSPEVLESSVRHYSII